MVMANKSGLMVLSMKVTGMLIKLTDKENYYTLTAISTKEFGKTIRLMEKEPTLMQMVLDTLVIGRMINNTAMEQKHGQMEQFTKVNTVRVKRMEKAS